MGKDGWKLWKRSWNKKKLFVFGSVLGYRAHPTSEMIIRLGWLSSKLMALGIREIPLSRDISALAVKSEISTLFLWEVLSLFRF